MSKEKPTFHVKVVDADQVLIEADAESLSANNHLGKFDVLPGHQPFICLLNSGDIIIRKPDRQIETVTVEKGILRVMDDEAVILVNL